MTVRSFLGAAVSSCLLFAARGALAQDAQAAAPSSAPTAEPAQKVTVEVGMVGDVDTADAEQRSKQTDAQGTVGLRTSLLRADKSTMGVSFAGRTLEYTSGTWTTARDSFFWNLGGGQGGFEGGLGGSLAGGVRLPLDKTRGFVLRGGLEAYMLGNNYFYASLFELPQGQFGFQYMHGRSLFEVGAKTGAVLTGRYRDPQEDVTRKLSAALEVGGYASLHFTPVRFDASFTRINALDNDPGTPVHVAEGAVCGLARWFSVCVDGRFERGDLVAGDDVARSFQSTYAGLTVGFGYRRDEHGREAKSAHAHGVAAIANALF